MKKQLVIAILMVLGMLSIVFCVSNQKAANTAKQSISVETAKESAQSIMPDNTAEIGESSENNIQQEDGLFFDALLPQKQWLVEEKTITERFIFEDMEKETQLRKEEIVRREVLDVGSGMLVKITDRTGAEFSIIVDRRYYNDLLDSLDA